MNNEFILEKLKDLGIYKSDQLKSKDISFWHLKTFKKNIKNEEKLILINNAKENLDSFESDELRKILDNYNYSGDDNNDIPINQTKNNNESFNETNPFSGILKDYKKLIDDYDNHLKTYDQKIKEYKKSVAEEILEKAEESFNRKDYQLANISIHVYLKLKNLRFGQKVNNFSHFIIEVSLENLKQYDQAIQDFTNAIKLGDKKSNSYFNRGKCKYYRERWDSAIEDFSEAITLNKGQNPEFYYFRGLSKNGLKKLKML